MLRMISRWLDPDSHKEAQRFARLRIGSKILATSENGLRAAPSPRKLISLSHASQSYALPVSVLSRIHRQRIIAPRRTAPERIHTLLGANRE